MLSSCAQPAGTVALLGAHGGAGVTSLLRAGLDQVAVDADRCWPRAGSVLLVARTSTSGLEWARDLARQHASGRAGDVELLGLVLVPDAPGRLPARISGLRDLVCGAFGRTWHLPWLEPWRLAASTEPLPAHPAVQQLLAELARTCQLPPPRQLSRPRPVPRHPSPRRAPVSTALTALAATRTPARGRHQRPGRRPAARHRRAADRPELGRLDRDPGLHRRDLRCGGEDGRLPPPR